MLLTLDLVPGLCVGAFTLGMPLAKAVELARANKRDFRCVELKYADQEPLAHDIILNFPEHGLHLRFEPSSQRLRLIEVYDASRMQLCCGAGLLGGASHAATAQRVLELLGPTVPGAFDAAARLLPLHYPGLLCLFPVPPQHAAHCAAHAGELPLEFPDDTTPVACRICVYAGAAGSPAEVAAARPPPPPRGSCQAGPVQAVLHAGLRFPAAGGQWLRFGDSPQDVAAQLGCPSSTAAKPPDAAATPGKRRPAGPPDYFYCYAERGIDVLFDGRSHAVKKFVLHSNAPGHAAFASHAKCDWRLLLAPPPPPADGAAAAAAAEGPGSDAGAADAWPADAGGESDMRPHSGLGGTWQQQQAAPAQRAADGACRAPDSQLASPESAASANGKGLFQGLLEELVMPPSHAAGTPQQQQQQQQAAAAAEGVGQPWDWGGDWTRNLLDIGGEAFALSPRQGAAPEDSSVPGSQAATPRQQAGELPQQSPRFVHSPADPAAPPEQPGAEDAAAGASDGRNGWEADLDVAMLGMELAPADAPPAPADSPPAAAEPTPAPADSSPAAAQSTAAAQGSLPSRSSGSGRSEAEAGGDRGSGGAAQAAAQPAAVGADSRLEQVRALLGGGGPAMVGGRGLGPHPFGRTRVLGWEGLALEVMRNGHIASATLFQPAA